MCKNYEVWVTPLLRLRGIIDTAESDRRVANSGSFETLKGIEVPSVTIFSVYNNIYKYNSVHVVYDYANTESTVNANLENIVSACS